MSNEQPPREQKTSRSQVQTEQSNSFPAVWKFIGVDAGSLGVLIDRELDTMHFIATGPGGVESECAMPIRKARELAKAIQDATGPWSSRS